eukprot:scaffold155298_cov31-Tisochrysis_lutea.AAC.1
MAPHDSHGYCCCHPLTKHPAIRHPAPKNKEQDRQVTRFRFGVHKQTSRWRLVLRRGATKRVHRAHRLANEREVNERSRDHEAYHPPRTARSATPTAASVCGATSTGTPSMNWRMRVHIELFAPPPHEYTRESGLAPREASAEYPWASTRPMA